MSLLQQRECGPTGGAAASSLLSLLLLPGVLCRARCVTVRLQGLSRGRLSSGHGCIFTIQLQTLFKPCREIQQPVPGILTNLLGNGFRRIGSSNTLVEVEGCGFLFSQHYKSTGTGDNKEHKSDFT